MLVCSVSLQVPRIISAGIAEAAAAAAVHDGHIVSTFVDIVEAADATATAGTEGNVFPTLVDDPASASDTVNGFLGQNMVEAASANAVVDAVSGAPTYTAAIDEVLTAASAQDAVIVSAKIWNPSDKLSTNLTNANLTATLTATGGVRATCFIASGKVYWECTVGTWANNNTSVGIALSTAALNTVQSNSTGAAYVGRTGAVSVNNTAPGVTLGTRASGNVIGIAVDFSAKLIWFRVAPAGSWNGSGTADPATGTGGVNISALTGSLFPLFDGVLANEACTANFGATAFTGSVPSGFSAGF